MAAPSHVSLLLALCAALALSRPSAALEPERLSLQWTAPPSCPSATYVRERIQRTIGPADARHQPVDGAARVLRADDGTWSVTLQTRQGSRTGMRTFEAATCLELADATALIVAMMIVREPEPEAPEEPPAPVTKRPAPAPARPAPARPAPRTARPVEPPTRDQARIVVSPLLALDAGSLPSLALGVGVAGGIAWDTARVELGGTLWPARSAGTVANASAGSDVALVVALAQGCATPWRGAARLDACAGAEVGRLRAEGFGVAHTQTESALWSAIGGGLLLTWPVGDLALRLQAGAAAPLSRPSVVLQPYGEVHRPSAVVVRGAIGLSWTIP